MSADQITGKETPITRRNMLCPMCPHGFPFETNTQRRKHLRLVHGMKFGPDSVLIPIEPPPTPVGTVL